MSVTVLQPLYSDYLETSGGSPLEITLLSSMGPQGPQGPAGPAAGDLSKTADQALGGGRVVRSTGANTCDYARADVLSDNFQILGVTKGAASSGALVDITTAGELTGLSGLTPGALIYCGLNGVLTQTFSASWAFSRVVGWAISATTMIVQIREPIALTP